MQLRIRSKFIGILVIAAVLPLLIAVIALQVLGYYHFRGERGRLYEAVARHLVYILERSLDREIDKLDDWMVLARPDDRLIQLNQAAAAWSAEQLRAEVASWEARWPGLAPTDPALQPFLTNPLARILREFQAINPLFAEILVTDARGRLVAATAKTSDYWQADEMWWQRAQQVRPGYVYLEGIIYDESARVFSVDVCAPIRSRADPAGTPVGTIKAILNTSAVFVNPPRMLADRETARQIVFPDGVVFSDLQNPGEAPFTRRLRVDGLELGGTTPSGWTVTRLEGDQDRLVGYARLTLKSDYADRQVASGVNSMAVLVHDDLGKVLAPVRRQLRLLGWLGLLLLLLFGLSGYYIATRKIITPIELLRQAVRMIAASAKISRASTDERTVAHTPQTAQLLEGIPRIQTRDEIQDLARDFDSMARRILSYHEQLEEELAAKISEMQRDLEMAHEFQEALMPRNYPQVVADARSPLQLRFHHEYQAASTVGGDFFDLHKLADHRVGIFIADVMGHGARAALVTAILRTLLQDLVPAADQPAKFLALMNQQFFDITNQTNQFVFASAFYMVIDTERALASYAAAGHPSPLLVDRDRGLVTPLIERLENNPALGVFRDSAYTNFTSFIKPGDLFVLFTDGLTEATNADGDEFGRRRVEETIKRHLTANVTELSRALLTAVRQYLGSRHPADDICLVAVEVTGASA